MTSNAPLGREGILALKDKRKIQTIEVAEFGTIHVRMSDARGAIFTSKYLNTPEYVAALFVACVVDESGSRVFSLTDEDVNAVLDLPESVLAPVIRTFNEMNRPAIEEELKNSPASATTDSPTDSAAISESQ